MSRSKSTSAIASSASVFGSSNGKCSLSFNNYHRAEHQERIEDPFVDNVDSDCIDDQDQILKFQRLTDINFLFQGQNSSNSGSSSNPLRSKVGTLKITCAAIDASCVVLGTESGYIYLVDFNRRSFFDNSSSRSCVEIFKVFNEKVNDVSLDTTSSPGSVIVAR